MYIKIHIKRGNDSKKKILFLKEEEVIKFLNDLNKKSFGTLGGKLHFGKLKDLDIFQIFSINYDNFTKKEGYLIWEDFIDEPAPGRFMPIHEIDNMFHPMETDITTDFIEEHLFHRNKEDKTVIVSYRMKDSKLIINGEFLSLAESTQYKSIVRTFLEFNLDSVSIFDLTEKMNFMNREWEKGEKTVRNAISYFNKQISENFKIGEIIGIDQKNVVTKIPVILNNSD